MPGDLRGDWTIEWLVEDRSDVERGEPIAIADHEGERFLAFAPESGNLRITIADAFQIYGKAIQLAQLLVGQVKSKPSSVEVGMDERQKVWLEKMDKIIKEAVKQDFAAVTAQLSTTNGKIDAVEKRLGSIDTRLDTMDPRLDGIEGGVEAIKKHLGVK